MGWGVSPTREEGRRLKGRWGEGHLQSSPPQPEPKSPVKAKEELDLTSVPKSFSLAGSSRARPAQAAWREAIWGKRKETPGSRSAADLGNPKTGIGSRRAPPPPTLRRPQSPPSSSPPPLRPPASLFGNRRSGQKDGGGIYLGAAGGRDEPELGKILGGGRGREI